MSESQEAALVRDGDPSPWNEEHDVTLGDGGLRAAVFGVSDGLVSSIGLVLGVFAASLAGSSEEASGYTVFASGIAGMLAGACSMAAGEWISMTAQAEALEKELQVEREHLENFPQQERHEMIKVLQLHGLEEETAILAVNDLEKRPDMNLDFHARFELGIDPDELGSPMKAMLYSFLAFTFGAIFPVLPWIGTFEEMTAFYMTISISLVLSMLVGMVCSRFTSVNMFYSGSRQVFVAVVTALLTSGVGYLMGMALGEDLPEV